MEEGGWGGYGRKLELSEGLLFLSCLMYKPLGGGNLLRSPKIGPSKGGGGTLLGRGYCIWGGVFYLEDG